MKRLIFSLIAMLTLLGWDLHAQETVTIVPEGSTISNPTLTISNGSIIGTSYVVPDICSLAWEKHNQSTSQVTSSQIRWYKDDILTISPSNGLKITEVYIKTTGGKFKGPFTAKIGETEAGTVTAINNDVKWTGDATQPLILTASAQLRCTSIQISYEEAGASSTVTFNPAQTEQHNPFELTLTAEEGKTILYSLDGSEPSTTYTAPISITAASTTVKAKIEGTDEVVEKTYTITTAKPYITVEGDNSDAYGAKNVTITSKTTSAKIYYTLDGNDPTDKSTLYTAPFPVSDSKTVTVKAIAIADNSGSSEIASWEVRNAGKGNPTATPTPGLYDEYPVSVELKVDAKYTDAKIYYTLDGSEPTDKSTLYTAPIEISHTTTIKAISYNGTDKSGVTEFLYKIDAIGTETDFNFSDNIDEYYNGEWTESFNKETQKYSYSAYPDTIISNGIAIVVNFGTATGQSRFRLFKGENNNCAFRTSKNGAQKYGQTITFVAPEGQQIRQIILTGAEVSKVTFDNGDYDTETNTWSGAASSVTLDPKDVTNALIIDQIKVICSESIAPVFNWNTGTYYEPFNLAISTGLQGGKIAYTIDGSDPVVSYNATEKKWVIGNGTEYSAPIAIEANTTVKAVAYGQRENPVNHIVENYVSDINAATYTFGQVDALPKEVDCLYRLLDWFTTWEAADETNGFKLSDKVTYPNINKTVQLPFAMMLTACSNEVAYMDDNFLPDYNSGIAIRRPNTPWADLYKVNDVFNEGMIVSFEWENEVTPSLVLHNVPSLYQYDTDPVAVPTMTVDSLLASAAWNEQDIYNGKVHNEWLRTQLTEVDKDGKKVTVNPTGFTFIPAADLKITLLNPTTVNEIVTLTDVEFSKATRANKGNNPTASFTGKGKEGGKSVTFITRFPIKSYAPGTYDVTGIVGYDIEIVTGDQDVWDETAKKDVKKKVPVDTIVSAVLYPVSMTAKGQTGEITEGTFELADAPAEGKMLLAAADMAFASLAENKKYGWMPIQEVTDENGVIKTNPDLAVTLEPTDGDAFFMKDVYGRYIYQTGSFNNFNVSAELPENTEEATWTFEPSTDENGNTAWFIANMATQKFIQYSTSHKSYGCYPEMQADGLLPRIYTLTGTSTGITEALAPEADGAVEVFNLQGIRLGNSTNGLPAGMYIIRQGRTATKVMLR